MSRDQSSTPSRRAMLTGALAGLSVAASGSALARVASEPDARLLDIGRRCMEAYAKREAFYRDVVEPAERRYEEIAPEPPSEMLARPGDYELLSLQGTTPSPVWVRTPDGSGRWASSFAEASVELMRNTPRTQQDWDNMVSVVMDGKAIRVHGTKPHPKAQARANEIVAAYDTLMAARREQATHCGLTKADEAYTILTANIEALVAELVEYPATTFRGLMMKAKCAELDGLKIGGYDWLFTQEVEADGGHINSTAGALAIARDLARLANEGLLS